MHFESDSIEITTAFDTQKIKKNFFLDRYQMGLEQSIKGSNFMFDGVKDSYASVIR